MSICSIYLAKEVEKYDFIRAAREAGAVLVDVAGCGPGYYIRIDCTGEQALLIEKTWYTPEINAYTAEEAWRAWKAGRLTVGQLATWQERHNTYFDETGRAGGGRA